MIGALEDVPGEHEGEASSFHVRVLFHKAGERWISFLRACGDLDCLQRAPSLLPRKVRWTVGFDGRMLGTVEAATPDHYDYYAHEGMQDVVSGSPVPTVGARAREFGGFTEAPVYRPLVTVNAADVADPDRWKPASQDQVPLPQLRHLFRARYPKLCKADEKDESRMEPYPYGDAQVHSVKAYASARGWIIARLHLNDAVDCKDTEAGFAIVDPWFVIDPAGSGRYLDDGIWLVDAGDYDQDGRSELVFAISRYNRGGYELFYDDFSRRAVFQFSYH